MISAAVLYFALFLLCLHIHTKMLRTNQMWRKLATLLNRQNHVLYCRALSRSTMDSRLPKRTFWNEMIAYDWPCCIHLQLFTQCWWCYSSFTSKSIQQNTFFFIAEKSIPPFNYKYQHMSFISNLPTDLSSTFPVTYRLTCYTLPYC